MRFVYLSYQVNGNHHYGFSLYNGVPVDSEIIHQCYLSSLCMKQELLAIYHRVQCLLWEGCSAVEHWSQGTICRRGLLSSGPSEDSMPVGRKASTMLNRSVFIIQTLAPRCTEILQGNVNIMCLASCSFHFREKGWLKEYDCFCFFSSFFSVM